MSVCDGISDHKLVLLTSNFCPVKKNHTSKCVFNFSAADDEAVIDSLDLCFSDFEAGGDVSTLWNTFKNITASCLDKFVPKFQKKKQHNSWITRDIIHLKRAISRKRKSARKDNSVISSLSITLKQKIRSARDYFFGTTLVNFMKNAPQKFWGYLSGNNRTVDQLHIDGCGVTDPYRIVNELNSTFHSVFGRRGTTENTIEHFSLSSNVMQDINLNVNGIRLLLLRLDVKKSSGPDGIPNAFLKRYMDMISQYLYVLFNASLDQGCLPPDWLCGKVVPVHKDGSKLLPANYRPISLISSCCKLLEHIISSHITSFSESNNILASFQHGFRKKLSTTTQLVSVVHDFANAINKRKQIDAIFLDLSKAFDRVQHYLLLKKTAACRNFSPPCELDFCVSDEQNAVCRN